MKWKSKIQQFNNRFTDKIDDIELQNPDFITFLQLVWFSIRRFFVERPGHIIGSSFILIMIWGYHGHLELLKTLLPGWLGPGSDPVTRVPILPHIPWDQELISYWIGAVLLVIVPCLIIRFGFKQSLSAYGLGLPPAGRRKFAIITFLTLTVLSLPAFWIGTKDGSMQSVYPLYRGTFSSGWQFILYELTYLPFFIAIEFIFRGYLLFGLAGVRDEEIKGDDGGHPREFNFYKYALLIQMLSYTAWHLGKPTAEVWGTLAWGLPAGAAAYACRSIWPIIVSHWLLNIFLDAMIAKPF